MWGLGIFLIEFITWHLMGWKAVSDEFPEFRAEISRQGWEEDTFFRVDLEGNASVKAQIHDWVKRLRDHQRATPYICDFLSLITSHLLVAEKDKRIDAADLKLKLTAMYQKCQKDPDYTRPA